MRVALLALAIGGAVVVGRALYHRHTRARVSGSWLRRQERADFRNEFVGISWKWPVNKIANESGRWNAQRLRRRA